jgi:ribosomal protein S18 acetylase RimI-like enzyme
MTDAEWSAWSDDLTAGYAEEHTKTGHWSAEEALETARAEIGALLPDGLRTRDHHLYTVRDAADGESVGMLWINVRPKAGKPEAYIYDIQMNEDRRGLGYGRATMNACVARARELGADSVGLHVFGSNAVARKLYTSLGFIETDVLMSLPLAKEDA